MKYFKHKFKHLYARKEAKQNNYFERPKLGVCKMKYFKHKFENLYVHKDAKQNNYFEQPKCNCNMAISILYNCISPAVY